MLALRRVLSTSVLWVGGKQTNVERRSMGSALSNTTRSCGQATEHGVWHLRYEPTHTRSLDVTVQSKHTSGYIRVRVHTKLPHERANKIVRKHVVAHS